jgi:hypothetical protein
VLPLKHLISHGVNGLRVLKNYRLDKSAVGVILTTISAIVPAQIENFQDDFIFKYSILI